MPATVDAAMSPDTLVEPGRLDPGRPEPGRHGPGRLELGGLLASEWTKIRSLRFSVAALGFLVALTIGFTALFVALTVNQSDQVDPVQKLTHQLDPTRLILGAEFQLSQLAVCVLGERVISNEYSSGTIRSSLLAVPRRTPMLIAKAFVFAVVVFVVGEVASFTAFAVACACTVALMAVADYLLRRRDA